MKVSQISLATAAEYILSQKLAKAVETLGANYHALLSEYQDGSVAVDIYSDTTPYTAHIEPTEQTTKIALLLRKQPAAFTRQDASNYAHGVAAAAAESECNS